MSKELTPVYTNNFSKDVRRMKKRGVSLEKLEQIMELLVKQIPLDKKHRPHILKGKYKGMWECHVSNDLLLVWEVRGEYIYFNALGTHSDLF